MAKIVLSQLDKLDFRTTLVNVGVLELAEQLIAENKETTYVLTDTAENLKVVGNGKNQVYIPSTMLTADNQNPDLHVYFDLENYPFYQKAKEIISKESKPKGVFRFRRSVKQATNNSLFAEDLYVLSALLGEPQDVHVKQTDRSVTPAHIIIMMNFGGGTMAHIEYTVTDQERIELEWSGIKNIIEFDSDEMNPIQPGNKTTLPLAYSVDSILATAHKADQALVDRLNHFGQLINGGADK